MKYNLEKYDEVIHGILAQSFDALSQISLNDLLKNENIQIKREIRETVFSLKSNSKIEHYIHKQQLALENLIILVRREINPERRKDLYKISGNNSREDNLKIIFKRLEKLQVFLENDYSNYLNLERIVPFRSFSKRRKANIPKIEGIRKSKTSAELSFALLEIICRQNNLKYGRGITYHKFNYNNEFISELFTHLSNENGIIYDNTIIQFLIEMNYNTKSFFKFQIQKITKDLNTLPSDQEKIDYLLRTVKIYNQWAAFSRSVYNKKRLPISEQIVIWVEEEIKYLSQNPSFEKTNHIPSLPANRNKILINLSVAQVSCFFNLLNEAGIITPKNQKDVFRVISDCFRTANTENISVASISSKYYNIETSAKEAVKSKIIDLLNVAKK